MKTPLRFLAATSIVLIATLAVWRWQPTGSGAKSSVPSQAGVHANAAAASAPDGSASALSSSSDANSARAAAPVPTSAAPTAQPAVPAPMFAARTLRDRFAIRRVLYHAEGPRDPNTALHQRIEIVQPDLECPPLRLVELVYRDPQTHSDLVVRTTAMAANHVLVKFQPGLSTSTIAARLATRGLSFRTPPGDDHLGTVAFALGSGDALPGVLAELRQATDLVATAEPNYVVTTQDVQPNDPRYLDGSQWPLHNTGQADGVAGQDIHAPEAWAVSTDAQEVVVAILDTGMRLTHEDLVANLWTNPGETGLDAQGRDKATNGIDDDGDGFVDDVHGIRIVEYVDSRVVNGNPTDDMGHGTHVAGIIGASGNNGKGIAGVAWRVRLLPVKFLNASGFGFISDAVEGIDYARRMGAIVCNNSWGSTMDDDSQLLREALARAGNAGMVIVCAAGNDGVDSTYSRYQPANLDLPMLVSVASLNRRGELSDFSNFGGVHLAAPGEEILSTFFTADNAYRAFSGTSMAAPHVTGVVALLRARYPAESPTEIVQRLISGAADSARLTKPMLYPRALDARRPLAEPSLPHVPVVAVAQDHFQNARGSSITLEAVVTSELPARMQWYLGTTPITGATNNRLALPNLRLEDGGRYSLRATNSAGTAYGWPVLVEVFGPPTILNQPADVTAVETTDAMLSVNAAANGDPRLRFQWFFNDRPLDAPSASVLTLRSVSPAQAGTYRVVITNSYGQVTSANASLTVTPAQAPTITRPPAALSITADQDAVFSVAVTGAPAPTLQWRREGVDLAGATESTLRISRAQAADAGGYTVVVTNSRGQVISATAQLTVAFAPVAPFIVRQPVARQVRYGEGFQLTVEAKGTPTPTLQWRRNGTALPGATAATYAADRANPDTVGDFSVVITNAAGAVVSDTATVALTSVTPLDQWSWRAPLPHGSMLQGLTFANGRFVAVGNRGMISTSPDAIVWTTRSSSTVDDLYWVAASPTRLVAEGGGRTMVVSDDGGLTWTAAPEKAPANLVRTTWGNGRFLAIDAGAQTLYASTDGLSWTNAGKPAGMDAAGHGIADLTFADGAFLACSVAGDLASSADGVTWQAAGRAELAPAFAFRPTLAVGAGVTVLVDSNGNILSSVDRTNWTKRRTGVAPLSPLRFINGLFVINNASSFLVSRDGTSWENRPVPLTAFGSTGLAFGNGLFVICGSGGSVNTSPDLTTWTKRAPEAADSYLTVAFGPAGFLAAGEYGARTSTDGILWTRRAMDAANLPVQRLAVIGGRYFGLTRTRKVLTTADGVGWAAHSIPGADATAGAQGIAFAGGRYVVVGARILSLQPYVDEARIYTSTDLDNWTSVDLGGLQGGLQDILFDGRRFVAAGRNGNVLTSPDGLHWTVEQTDVDRPAIRIAYDGSLYVIVTEHRAIFTSPDLRTWTKATLPTGQGNTEYALGFADLLFTAGQFIALDMSGRLVYSADGRTWTESLLPHSNLTMGLAVGADTIVVAANDGGILQSGPLRATLGSIAVTPAREMVVRGESVTLALEAFGIGQTTQQWRKDGSDLAGQTRSVLNVPAVEPSDAGRYDVHLRQGATEADSRPAYLAVVEIPASVDAAGGSGRIVVTAPDGYSWNFGTLASWFAFDTDAWGSGSGTVSFHVEPNQGDVARTATFVFGGRTFLMTQPAPAATGRLVNLSTRAHLDTGADPLIAGFVITGTQPKRVLLRAAGPALSRFGITDALAHPRLQLFSAAGVPLQSNDSWEVNAADVTRWTTQTGAFPFASGSRDAALVTTLAPGAYTLQVSGLALVDAGTALVEIYEARLETETLAGTRLVNVSSRGRIAGADGLLISGFVVGGQSSKRVLIRGVGPTLARFHVGDALADTTVELRDAAGALVARNDNWQSGNDAAAITTASAEVGAFSLEPGSRDAALLQVLPPGNYTAIVRSASPDSGTALLEIYEVPSP